LLMLGLAGISREPATAAAPSKQEMDPAGEDAVKRAQALSCLAVMLLPAACMAAPGHASAGGTVTGRLMREGGPLGPGGQQPGTHPIPGTVRFTGGHHRVITVRTNSAGMFSVQLPAGRYDVSDRSPRILLVGSDGIGRQAWSSPVSVTVTAHHTTRVTLTSIVP